MFSYTIAPHPLLKRQNLTLLGLAVILHAAAALVVTQLERLPPPFHPPRVLQMAWFGEEKKTEAPPPARPLAPPKNHNKVTPHAVRVVHHQPVSQPEPAAPPPVLTAEATPEATQEPNALQAPTAPAPAEKPAATDDTSADSGQQHPSTAQATAPAGPMFRPDYLNNPRPQYPRLSRELHEQGRVMLRVLISPDGLAKDVALKKSSGFARLDASAIDAVRDWRFLPAHQGDTPVASWVVIPIDFKLESSVS